MYNVNDDVDMHNRIVRCTFVAVVVVVRRHNWCDGKTCSLNLSTVVSLQNSEVVDRLVLNVV